MLLILGCSAIIYIKLNGFYFIINPYISAQLSCVVCTVHVLHHPKKYHHITRFPPKALVKRRMIVDDSP